MALTPGTRLGPFEIVAKVGEGGMGEVYRATDTRLNRTVAIKVLPPHFGDNPDIKQRFDREAQTIAGLNHPNICTLHDVGAAPAPEAGLPPVSYLVMEYLEGETLADRIARGHKKSTTDSGAKSGPMRALGVDEAIRIASAIADALDKAHRQGVVHRDLKPTNVMLVKSGGSTPLVKLLDFGLAKWVVGSDGSLGALQTRTDLSTPGMILGTLQYMAPEQVEGKDADARTDIFALGALIYEMVTGRRAFEGKSQATLISAIMTGEPPPMSTLQPLAPAALDHVVRRCLAKDPDDRWQDAHSLLLQLRWIAQGRTESEVPAAFARAGRKRARVLRIALAAAVALVVALAVPAVLYVRGPEPPAAFPFRVPVMSMTPGSFAVAPDGREIAIVAQPDGQESAAMFVRRLDAPVFRRLPGTEEAVHPFWSPDSRSVAFVVGRRLKRIDTAGGGPKEIAEVSGFSGGAWNRANTIIFGTNRGLFKVPAEGGTPEPVTQVESQETGHFWPSFLPDGVHYLFTAWSSDRSRRAVYIGSLQSKEKKQLMAAETNAVFATSAGIGRAPGHLLFHREESLFAQHFDLDSRALTGEAAQIAGTLSYSSTDGRGRFSASETGVLVFDQSTRSLTTRAGIGTETFAWVDRTGGPREEAAVPIGQHGDMDLSPDQRYIAITRHELSAPAADIWVIDWRTGVENRLTLDQSDDINPVWSPDSSQVAFTSYRSGNADIFVVNASGLGGEKPLVQTPADEFAEAWSRDGRYLAYLAAREDGYQDIHVLPLEGDRKPIAVVQGPYRKDEPQFSYDGKWIAYTSDKSSPGKFEVYVISFPGLDQERKVSIGGGGQPRWRQDGRELYYRTISDYMAVEVSLGPKLDSGVPFSMFPTRTPGGGNVSSSDPTRHQWAAAPDGRTFLVRVPPAGGPGRNQVPLVRSGATPFGRGRGRGLNAPALTVILHWPASLRTDQR